MIWQDFIISKDDSIHFQGVGVWFQESVKEKDNREIRQYRRAWRSLVLTEQYVCGPKHMGYDVLSKK